MKSYATVVLILGVTAATQALFHFEDFENAAARRIKNEISKLANETSFHMGFVKQLIENEVQGELEKVDQLLEQVDQSTKGLQECVENVSEEVKTNVKNFTNALDQCRNQATVAIHEEFSLALSAIESASNYFGNYRQELETCERRHSSMARLTCKIRVAKEVESSFRKYSSNVRHVVLDNVLKAPKLLKITAECVTAASSHVILSIKNILSTAAINCNPFAETTPNK
ncbi:hypothetical protein ACFFRR_005898 [Megaselia abdita]